MAALKSIDPNFDFGGGVNAAGYQQAIDSNETDLENYNITLSLADERQSVFQKSEKILQDWNERVLTGVGTRYGKDSLQYDQAGGTRKSERKRPVRKKKTS